MGNEDLKVLTFRLEKTAFLLGKICGNILDLISKCPDGEVKQRLMDLSECLATDCGELYYPRPYFVNKAAWEKEELK